MELENAIQLITKGVESNGQPQVWADLGAGSGLFSRALSSILPDKSIIHAVDKNYKTAQQIKSQKESNTIVLSKKRLYRSIPGYSCMRRFTDGQLTAFCKR